eukprot:scaffold32815_cov69-Phaeocystis_antarctica.AAC.2
MKYFTAYTQYWRLYLNSSHLCAVARVARERTISDLYSIYSECDRASSCVTEVTEATPQSRYLAAGRTRPLPHRPTRRPPRGLHWGARGGSRYLDTADALRRWTGRSQARLAGCDARALGTRTARRPTRSRKRSRCSRSSTLTCHDEMTAPGPAAARPPPLGRQPRSRSFAAPQRASCLRGGGGAPRPLRRGAPSSRGTSRGVSKSGRAVRCRQRSCGTEAPVEWGTLAARGTVAVASVLGTTAASRGVVGLHLGVRAGAPLPPVSGNAPLPRPGCTSEARSSSRGSSEAKPGAECATASLSGARASPASLLEPSRRRQPPAR